MFLKVIAIGENVIRISNYVSITFSMTSFNLLTQSIRYMQPIKYNMLYISYLFVIMYHNMQKLNKAALNICKSLVLSTLFIFWYGIDYWNWYFVIGIGIGIFQV